MKLWYKQSAKNWNEALPLGDGHLGAMVYGNTRNEVVSLNNETIWYRGAVDRNNPDSSKYLSKVRQLLMEDKVSEAEELMKLTMFGTPRDQSHYEFMGELFIDQIDVEPESIKDYHRELDLEKATLTVSYMVNDVDYRRVYFVSKKSHTLVVQYKSSQPNKLNLNIQLGREKRFSDKVEKFSDQGIVMSASAGGVNGTKFKVGCLLETDGEKNVLGETIVGRNMTTATILLTSATDYYRANDDQKCFDYLQKLLAFNFGDELDSHINNYQKLFNRVSLNIADPIDDLPTDERLKRVKDGEEDNYLLNLYFNYGRYLLISSSQPGGLPANLQGIWSENTNPIWGSKFTININTEMNYWMAGPCDLSEMEEPLFDLLNNLRPHGRITAQKMYNARGFTAHHNTDAFFDTAPQSHAIAAAIWNTTVPWLCTHIWEHYLFTGDKDFLEKNYPVMKEAAEFYEDYLFEFKGHLVTGPSVSPENKYRLPNGTEGNVCLSPTIDNQILRYFFQCVIESAKILQIDKDFADKIAQMRAKLPKTKIGKHGQVQEWLEDYDEVEPGHRHISPLFGLFPGHEINEEETPELINAAQVTIKRRLENGSYLDSKSRADAINGWTKTGFVGGKRTGWSSAWLVNFFARLHNGQKANEELYGMLRNSTLNNLFDDHPPFQIDGNFGAVSGICEMLIQSQNGFLELLPALPQDWTTGNYRGLRARGNVKVDVSWNDGKVKTVILHGIPNKEITLRIKSERMNNNKSFDQSIVLDDSGKRKIEFK